jgi:hypothetical protein
LFVTFALVRVSAELLKPHERAELASLVNSLTSAALAGVAETAPSDVPWPDDPDGIGVGVGVGVAARDAVGGVAGLLAAGVGLDDPPHAATRHKVLTAKPTPAASRADFSRPPEVSYGMTGLLRFEGQALAGSGSAEIVQRRSWANVEETLSARRRA